MNNWLSNEQSTPLDSSINQATKNNQSLVQSSNETTTTFLSNIDEFKNLNYSQACSKEINKYFKSYLKCSEFGESFNKYQSTLKALSIKSNPNMRRIRTGCPKAKNSDYVERREKCNTASKKSRNCRHKIIDGIAARAAELERKNYIIKLEILLMKERLAALK